MNPFRPLLKLLDFVLGHDLHERAAEKKQPEVRRPRRDQAPRGDGFDAGSRGPQVDLRGGVKVAPRLPDEPVGPLAVIEPSNFNASLDDLRDVVDEPMEPRAEFIPEGGMSTESLMREFSSLDVDTQAAAVDAAAAKELALSLELENPEKFVDSFEGAPAAAPQPQAPLDFSHVVDSPLEPKPEFVPPGAVSTESLMSEFEALDAETQAAAIEEAASKELERAQAEAETEAEAEAEVDSFEPSVAQERMTPAWLIPATTAAPKPAVPLPPPELSTESLMSEFGSLDADTQQAAIDEAAAKELARQEAEEQKGAEEVLAPHPDPLPAPQGEGAPLTPAWLIPATTAAPKKPVPLPPPELSTESLMSEFESLDAQTQQAAIDEAAARELARQQAEEKKRAQEENPLLLGELGESED